MNASPPKDTVHRVAYRIARVIARKAVESDPGLRKLDGLGKVTAIHELASNMVDELLEEAAAAYAEAVAIQHEEAAHESL